MRKFLSKYNGANPHQLLLVSATLTLCSLLITWIIELFANAVLLHY
jgi:hypothetical protein